VKSTSLHVGNVKVETMVFVSISQQES